MAGVPNDVLEKLKSSMRAEMPSVLADLKGLIAIPSVSADKTEVKKALDYVLKTGESMGFEAKSCCDGQVGVIEYGQGEETLGILGHVDVVPAGDRKNWLSDPFGMEVRDGKVYGRGTIDDKGPVMLSLHAMKVIKESGLEPKKKIQLILGTQEEVDWVDMREYVKKEKLPDYAFTPDGEYPLCNIEKGIVDADFCYEISEKDIKPEKGKCKICSIDAGIMANGVPGYAEAVVKEFDSDGKVVTKTVGVKGKAVHSSMPEKGENALYILADKCRECGISGRLAEILSFLKEGFCSVYGKEIGLMSDGEHYHGEFVHRNTFSVTMLKTEDLKVRAHVNIRYAYGTDANDIIRVLEELAEKSGGRLEVTDVMPAVYVAKDRRFVGKMIEAYEEATGLRHEDTLAYGGSYAKAMPNAVSFGPLFPGEEDTCHEDNEYFSLDSMEKNAMVIVLTLAKICLTEEKLK